MGLQLSLPKDERFSSKEMSGGSRFGQDRAHSTDPESVSGQGSQSGAHLHSAFSVASAFLSIHFPGRARERELERKSQGSLTSSGTL